MPRVRAVILVACALGAVLPGARAAASTADVFGLGPAASAQAGAVAASVTDFSAAYYNPAGLAFDPTVAVSAGFSGAGSRLRINGARAPLADQSNLLFGARLPIPFGGFLERRLTLGLAVGVPPTSLLRVISRYPQDAFFPLYDNRTQRLLLLPALGVRLTDRLALGIGFNYFAALSGAVVGLTGASRAIEPRADQAIGARLGVHAGVRWDPRRWLSLAMAYRQQFDVPFRVDADMTVAGAPLSLAVRSAGLFTPHEVVWGAAFRPRAGTTLGVDLTWARWSAWGGPYIQVTSRLPLAGDIVGELPHVPFKDIVTAHVGGEQRLFAGRRLELLLRAGYGFDPSPVPAVQAGVTNLMDGPKHVVAVGAGARLQRVLPRTVTLDASFGLHVVGERTYTKHVFGPDETPNPFRGIRDEVPDVAGNPASQGVQSSNPGYPSIKGGGVVWSASVMLGVEL